MVPAHEVSLAGGAGQHFFCLTAFLTDLVAHQALHHLLRRQKLLEAHRTFRDPSRLHLNNLSSHKSFHLPQGLSMFLLKLLFKFVFKLPFKFLLKLTIKFVLKILFKFLLNLAKFFSNLGKIFSNLDKFFSNIDKFNII